MSDVTRQLRSVIAAFRQELSNGLEADDCSGSYYTEVRTIAEELLSHITEHRTKHVATLGSDAYTIVQESLEWISNIHFKEQIRERLDSLVTKINDWKELLTDPPQRPLDTKFVTAVDFKIDFESRDKKNLKQKKSFEAYTEKKQVAKREISNACTELLAELGRELGWHRGQNDGKGQVKLPTSQSSDSPEQWIRTKVGLDFCMNPMAVRNQSNGEVEYFQSKIRFGLLKLIASRGRSFSSKEYISDRWVDIGGRSNGRASLKTKLTEIRKRVLDKWEMVFENCHDSGWRVSSAPNLWEERKKEIEKAAAKKSNSDTQKQLKKN